MTKDRRQTKVTPSGLLWLANRFDVDLSAPSQRTDDSDTALAPLSRRRPSSTLPPKMVGMSSLTLSGGR
ncbi:hypothetical protein JYJ95_16175 [Corallococcus exiguus]|uniref:hypothetical protein n=1 Tax=Corallococcus exiguus TaxID=83462 RepID=UPI001A8F2BD3|nr:hypothetical protein [Corallococcus exiguus]MBN8468058.1 hypothetical protein [Corallococcus exiguus]